MEDTEVITNEQAGSPGSRKAEDILVRLKNDDGTIQEVPLLMIIADLFNKVTALEMKMAVMEPVIMDKKNSRIVTV